MRTTITVCNPDFAPTAPHGQQDTGGREAELRALMAMASHDLKNPLAAVTARVEMLREDYGELGENFLEDLAAIERGLHRMNRLIQELLDYSRTDRDLDLGPVPLDELVSDVVADHVPAAGSTPVTVAGTLPTVTADAPLLRHVLDNLIGNAVKYTPAGTAPDVEISAHTRPDGTTRVEVADHGIGIPDTERPRIFDAFHRCANSTGYPGTGLGLNICRRIIERHGGRIGVEHNPGGGSRFWFTLSAASAAPGEHAPAGVLVMSA